MYGDILVFINFKESKSWYDERSLDDCKADRMALYKRSARSSTYWEKDITELGVLNSHTATHPVVSKVFL